MRGSPAAFEQSEGGGSRDMQAKDYPKRVEQGGWVLMEAVFLGRQFTLHLKYFPEL